DHTLAEAHCSLAAIAYFFDWNWSATEKALERTLKLNPNSAVAHTIYSHLWLTRGRMDEALMENGITLELDPLSPLHTSTRVQLLYFSRRYDEALAEGRTALEMTPHFFLWYVLLGQIYGALRMHAEAIEEFKKGISAFGRHT